MPDFITNWYDGRYSRREKPCVNYIIDYDFSNESGSEPVEVEDVKQHMDITFPDKDAYISSLISWCRSAMEEDKAISLIPKTVTAILNNSCGGIELPYGPVNTVTAVADKEGNAVTGYKVRGEKFKCLETPYEWVKVTYTAGYIQIPNNLKLELLQVIHFCYENRGVDALKAALKMFSKQGSRKTWLV